MTKAEGMTFDQAANALGVVTVIRRELQFLIDWGFTVDIVTPWMAHFYCDGVVIRILRDPQGYEIVGDIADSRNGNWQVDFITARWIITGQRDHMIHAATREELIAGVEMCARVLRDLGRECWSTGSALRTSSTELESTAVPGPQRQESSSSHSLGAGVQQRSSWERDIAS